MRQAPISDLFGVVGPWGDYLLTTRGTLMCGLRLSGIDPDGLTQDDHLNLAQLAERIYGHLPNTIAVSQYFMHYSGNTVSLRNRNHPVSNFLSQRRVSFLNDSGMTGSSIIHYLEIHPPVDPNSLSMLQLINHAGQALWSPESRRQLRASLNPGSAFLMHLSQLDALTEQLTHALQQVVQKWQALFQIQIMSIAQMWAHSRFLANLNPTLLSDAIAESVPQDYWADLLADGDIDPVRVGTMDLIKLSGITVQYAKLATVRKLVLQDGSSVLPGLWSSGAKAATRTGGNYVLMTRWKPLTELERVMAFKSKNDAVTRQTIDFGAIMGQQKSDADKMATMKKKIRDRLDELGNAEALTAPWGVGYGVVAVFGNNPDEIKATAHNLDSAARTNRIQLTWESPGADDAYRALQPGTPRYKVRELFWTSLQMASASLLTQSSIGQPYVPDLQGEEAQYIFRSTDGKPFYYSPFVGGRAMVFGIGAIRSGKSFAKESIDYHYPKYGGISCDIGIDEGAEPKAQVFGSDGAIFRVSPTDQAGLNPFTSYQGAGDTLFKTHLSALLLDMLRANDTAEYQTITSAEQDGLDRSITNTLALPAAMRTFANLVAHMPPALARKFSRWRNDPTTGEAGRYAALFDVEQDSIGDINMPVSVFNLRALRDDSLALTPVLREITYRITRAFENPAIRHLPKQLTVDEAHLLFSIEGMAKFFTQRTRTGGKDFVSMQFWTQSPIELLRNPDWPALRGAATTFIFTADLQLDVNLYMQAFGLTEGECEAIRRMIPQRQLFIVQRALGIAKVVELTVEPEQYVLNTSHPVEKSIRERAIADHGFERGVALATTEIFALKQRHAAEAQTATLA